MKKFRDRENVSSLTGGRDSILGDENDGGGVFQLELINEGCEIPDITPADRKKAKGLGIGGLKY